jgi:hypothetical protein
MRTTAFSHSLGANGTVFWVTAYFRDRGRLFQSDRGRRFSVIVDAQGMRASEFV